MKIPKYARYDYCAKKACEFLEKFNITSYPIDVEKIIYENKWGLTPYSLLMEYFNCDRQTVIRCLRSEDGYTQLDCDNYSIAYNDDPTLGERKRFTLMHEVGHIYLNHLLDFDITLLYRGSLSQEENQVLENEANAFARNVLVPTSVFEHLKDKNIKNISYHFGISPTAAQTRLDLYQIDMNKNLYLKLDNRLEHIFHKFYYKKHCPICNYHTISSTLKFCPICGSDSIKWGEGDTMEYKTYETDENGRLKKCIICNNESLVGPYCHICGSPAENYCTDAHSFYFNNQEEQCPNTAPLPANARFCPICGSESVFKQKNLLIDWKKEKEQIENEERFMQIPEGIDEELPAFEDSSFSAQDRLSAMGMDIDLKGPFY